MPNALRGSYSLHEEGERGKGKGERGEEIVRYDCNPSLLIDLLYEGASNPYRSKESYKKFMRLLNNFFTCTPFFLSPLLRPDW
jgi:hypothetical protein